MYQLATIPQPPFSVWPNEDHNVYLDKMTRRVEHITGLWASSRNNQSDAFMVRKQ